MTFKDLESGQKFTAWPFFIEVYYKSGGYGHAYRMTSPNRDPVVFKNDHVVEAVTA